MATIDPIAGSAIWNGFVAVIEALGMNSDRYVIIYNSSDNIKWMVRSTIDSCL